MRKHLHIVCSGGTQLWNNCIPTDTAVQLRDLHQMGVQLHLHYFCRKALQTRGLHSSFYSSVDAYPIKKVLESTSLKTPYFISSRDSEMLAENLKKDAHPILMEGLAVTGILNRINDGQRRICVRMADDEIAYFNGMARRTAHPLKKILYAVDEMLTRRHVNTLPRNISYACANRGQGDQLQQQGFSKVRYVPIFADEQSVSSPTGMGSFCLFHGNLAAPETEKTAMWLLCRVFNRVRVPFVIAGQHPSRRIQKAAALCRHTCLVSDPGREELQDLIQKAHINVLPSICAGTGNAHQHLVQALLGGRHCVANLAMVEGTGLEAACHVEDSAAGMARVISKLYYQPFAAHDVKQRKQLLNEVYAGRNQIQKITDLLW